MEIMKFKSINSSKGHSLHAPVVCDRCLSCGGRDLEVHTTVTVTLVLGVMTQPVIPAPLICEFEASLGYTVRLCLYKEQNRAECAIAHLQLTLICTHTHAHF